jgi:hypothetical protein
MPFITGQAPESAEERYSRQFKEALAQGWVVLSEGPSGAQMELPKKMKTQTKVALVIGLILILLWGFGFLVIIAALIDYAMQKKETKFIARA